MLFGAAWVGEPGRANLLDALARLRIPTLVIHGEHDIIPVACAARIARAIPGARLVLLKECGHFSYLERPEEVRREIGGFMPGSEFAATA